MSNIRARLEKLEAVTPKREPDGLARERILAKLAAMKPYQPAPEATEPCRSVAAIKAWFAAHGYGTNQPEA